MALKSMKIHDTLEAVSEKSNIRTFTCSVLAYEEMLQCFHMTIFCGFQNLISFDLI